MPFVLEVSGIEQYWCCTASTLVRCCGIAYVHTYSKSPTHISNNYGYELRSYLVNLDLPAVHEPPRRKSADDGRCVDAGRFNLTVDKCPI